MEEIGGPQPVWVTSRTTGDREYRSDVVISDLRETVTRTLSREGANGPNGAVTQFILSAAERHLHDGLRSALGSDGSAGQDTSLLSRLLPLEGFGPDVLGISRNNLRRRWATSSDLLDDVVAYALRPGRADEHALRWRGTGVQAPP